MKKNADIYLNHNEILFTFVLNLFDINPFLLEKIFFKSYIFSWEKEWLFICSFHQDGLCEVWLNSPRSYLPLEESKSFRSRLFIYLLLFRMCMLKGRQYVFFMHVAFIFIYLLLIFWRYTQNVKLFFYM